MIKTSVIAMGKIKEKYLQSAVDEYLKRLSRFCDLKLIEIAPFQLPDNPSKAQIQNALKSEAVLIKKHIPNDSFVCSLCVEGSRRSSVDFANMIKDKSATGTEICFIIGSSHGLSDEIKELSDLRLSLSDMTFPHQLFRVMLLEQIYRGFMINHGSKYHK